MKVRRRLSPWQFLAVLGLFAATILLFLAAVSCVRRDEQEVDLGAKYYFLVENCEDSTAAAVAGTVYGRGGAGVTLGGGAVVVACYYTAQDAERVRSNMREKGTETRIEEVSAEKFVLKGGDAAYCGRVEANAATVETCARLLYNTANGLERAELGQAEARAAAHGAASSLAGLADGNAGAFFDRWNAELLAAARSCKEAESGLVFAKDLRRIQAQLLCALVGLGAYFS